MEPMKRPEFLVPMNYLLYSCGDHAVVFRKLSTIKPLNELMKRRHDRSNLVVRSCIEKHRKCSEDEFLVNHGHS